MFRQGSPPSRDRENVARFVATGDEFAFRELYRRHEGALYRFSVLRVGPDDAPDVVQETWLRAARGLADFAWRSSLRTWLIGIALNCCRERLRGRQRDGPRKELNPDEPGYDRRSVGGLRSDLQRALAALPARAREVVLLHDVEGYTHQEIGFILGVEPGTSKSQLSRGRAALRSTLDGERRQG